MILDDYTEFCKTWATLRSLFGKSTTKDERKMVFNALSRYSLDAVKKACGVCSQLQMPPLPCDIIRVIEFGVTTDAQVDVQAKCIWQQIANGYDNKTDYVFAHPRDALAFYIVLGTHKFYSYQTIGDEELGKRYVDAYKSCDIYKYHKQAQESQIIFADLMGMPKTGNYVTFINDYTRDGDSESVCTQICNKVYGVNNWTITRFDKLKPLPTPVNNKPQVSYMTKEDSIKALDVLIDELKPSKKEDA